MTDSDYDYDQDSVERDRGVAYQGIHDLLDRRAQEISEAQASETAASHNRFLMMLIDQNIHTIGLLKTGVRYVNRGEMGYDARWMEAVVYQDLGYHHDPSWHPAEPGCWQIAVHEEDGHLSVRSWHWDGQTNIRYEKDAIPSYIRFAIYDVYTGHAETSDARAARLAALNTPSIVALAAAIRAVIRDNRS